MSNFSIKHISVEVIPKTKLHYFASRGYQTFSAVAAALNRKKEGSVGMSVHIFKGAELIGCLDHYRELNSSKLPNTVRNLKSIADQDSFFQETFVSLSKKIPA